MAIAFDTSDHASSTNPTVPGFVRGTGASNYIGIAMLLPNGVTRTCSGVMWGSSSMTQIYDVADTLAGAGGHDYMFYIVNPPIGAVSVVATTTNSFQMDIETFSGVDQATPLDTNIDGASHSFVTFTAAPQTNTSVVGTSHVDNSLGVGQVNWDANSPSGGTNTTIDAVHLDNAYNTTAITPAGAIALKYTAGGNNNWVLTLVALQPSTGGGGGTTPRRALLGVGI